MTKECEHCGTVNPAAARFCRQCGQPWSQPWLRSATRLTPLIQQWRGLRHGCTRKEVRAILGEPLRIGTGDASAIGLERWRYEYEQAGERAARLEGVVEFRLPDGVLMAWTEPQWPPLRAARDEERESPAAGPVPPNAARPPSRPRPT